MKTNQRRGLFTMGAITGGLLAAAFLPIAVAFADEIDFTPNLSTFVPDQAEGYPPLINEVTGAEQWNVFDLTTNATRLVDILNGTDTETTFGSFTNDDFVTNGGVVFVNGTGLFLAPTGTQLDIANFGLGFENAWMDIPSTGSDPGISDLLITPFGDFTIVGSGFADLAAAF